MEVFGNIVGISGGVLGIVTFLYTVLRIGFRVDELWGDRDTTRKHTSDLAVLHERIENMQGYIFHRAEAEARVHHAIRDKSP